MRDRQMDRHKWTRERQTDGQTQVDTCETDRRTDTCGCSVLVGVVVCVEAVD